MAGWSEFLPDILPHVPGCPALIAEHEVRRAAQAFFEGARAWKTTLDPMAIRAGDEMIEIAADDGGIAVVRIEHATAGGTPVEVLPSPDTLPAGWEEHTASKLLAIIMYSPSEARLYPLPAEDTDLTLGISVRPSDAAPGIPDGLFRKYREAITFGAKSRLMMYSGREWSSMELGAAYGAAFAAAIDRATIDAARGFSGARIVARQVWC